MTRKPSAAWQMFRTGIILSLLTIPTILSIIALNEVRSHKHSQEAQQSDLLCLSSDLCALQHNGVWYKVTDVIDLNSTKPDHLRLPLFPNLVEEPVVPFETID